MNNTTKTYSYLIIAVALLTSHKAMAEKVTVKKVKGNQAIVETQTPLEEGQTYELQTDGSISQDVDYKSNVLKPRNNSLTLGAKLDFLKSDTTQSTSYSLQVRYGWNFGTLEVGALLEGTGSDLGAGATTTVALGGYFDYNLVPNRDPKKIIYGPFALVSFGSTSYPNTGTGGSSTTLNSNIGGFLSYFIGDSTTALRGEVFGTYQQVNTTATQASQMGGGFRGLLVFYF
ncbi:MAG: hypothetical protein ABL930_11695 [Pseudobdellovibrio sp.]